MSTDLDHHAEQQPLAPSPVGVEAAHAGGSCRPSRFERYLIRHCEFVLTPWRHRLPAAPTGRLRTAVQLPPEHAALVNAMLPVLPAPVRDTRPEVDSFQAGLSAELDLIEAVERAKAALDAHALTALARMQASTEAVVAAQPEPWRTTVPMTAEELVELEVATATGLGQREVHRRLALATGSAARCGRLRELLATGATTLYRACEVLEECRTLSDEDLDSVVQSVFAPTRDGVGLTQTLFRSRLRRSLLSVDADRAAAKARARSRIGAYARADRDGTGTLTIINDAGKIAAAMDRADAAARAARAKGDPRTIDQLRADFLTDAACFGWPTTAPCPNARCGPGADAHPGDDSSADDCSNSTDGATTDGAAVPGAFGGTASTGEGDREGDGDAFPAGTTRGEDVEGSGEHSDETAAGRDRAPTDCSCGGSGWVGTGFDRIGRQPAATVRVIVPLSTLFGFDNAPCELPGYGWIDAEQARTLATVPDSEWQALLADLDTGKALRLSREGYRPSQRMIDHVRAVDHTCRGPGCQVPADQCDLDHDIPHPIGPTDITNFTNKHRKHHRVRTARFWRAVRGEHDEVIWDTLAGRRYVTYPNDWLESTRPARRGGDNGIDYDPEPFTRPIGPEPDPNQPSPDPGPPPF